jgi:excisionase family DNA binding protein
MRFFCRTKGNNSMESNIQIQYITSQEGLKSALIDALTDLKLIPQEEPEAKSPATRQEACKFLNISLPTLDKLTASGQILTFKIGRQVRIRWSDIEAYVNNRR